MRPVLERNIVVKLRRNIRLAEVCLAQVALAEVLRCRGLVGASAALAAGFPEEGGGDEEGGNDDDDDVRDVEVGGGGEVETAEWREWEISWEFLGAGRRVRWFK